MPASPQIRPRRPDDVAVLIEILAAQQPHSHYPLRWPLPFPAENFIVRANEEAAWVAEIEGRPVGHVAAVDVAGSDWPAATGRSAAELCCVSTLFVAHERAGQGIGRALLDTAVTRIRERDRLPVLDVTRAHPPTLAFYRNRGWREIGRARPEWLPGAADDVVLMALEG